MPQERIKVQKHNHVPAWWIYIPNVSIRLTYGAELTASRGGSGWVRHHKQFHHCSSSNPCRPDDQSSSRTTHAELIKYAGALHAALLGVATKRELMDQYKISWAANYPNEPCDWKEEGNPPDHSEDDTYPGSTALSIGQPTISSSTLGVDPSTSALPPSSNHHIIPRPTPTTSSSALGTDPPTSARPSSIHCCVTPHPTPAPSSFPSSFNSQPSPVPFPSSSSAPPPHSAHALLNEDILTQFLRHSFPTQIKSNLSLIKGGFVPGFDARTAAPVCQRVLIVENPEHTVEKDAVPGSYLSQANLDPQIYDTIASRIPGSIRKMGRHSEPGKVSCVLPTWVSQ
jgi:hypothetical protein